MIRFGKRERDLLIAFILSIVSEAFDTFSISLFRETGPPGRIGGICFYLQLSRYADRAG